MEHGSQVYSSQILDNLDPYEFIMPKEYWVPIAQNNAKDILRVLGVTEIPQDETKARALYLKYLEKIDV